MKKTAILLSFSFLILFAVCFSGCKNKKSERTSYLIECEYDGEKTVVGREALTFYNDTENSFKQLKFNLFANAFRKDAKYSPISTTHLNRCYPNGINYGDIKILSVYDRDGDLNFSIGGEDENILVVELPEEVFPEERKEVTIEYKITLADVIARTGVNAKTVNLANFYPILCGIDGGGFYECLYYSSGDPYFSDTADYEVKFTCPKEYVIASSGESVNTEDLGDKRLSSFTLSNARSFCMVLSKDFKVTSKEIEGVTVNYYYCEDEKAKEHLDTSINAIKTFSKLFGEYPYKTFSVVKTPFIEGGMEFPTLVYISDSLENEAFNEVIVHETAHQWWQTVVGNNEIEYGFLDEGLTEYSVVLFYENNTNYGLDRETLVKSSEDTFKIFCTVYDKLYKKVDTSMLRPLGEFTSEYEYVNIAYIKSVIMYDTLRDTIGDKKFFDGLKRYYKDNAFLNAEPYSIVGAFEKSGADVSGYFSAFFEGKEVL